jgi:phage-related protein
MAPSLALQRAAADEIARLDARVAQMRAAFNAIEHHTHSLRTWDGQKYSYWPPQAESINRAAGVYAASPPHEAPV